MTEITITAVLSSAIEISNSAVSRGSTLTAEQVSAAVLERYPSIRLVFKRPAKRLRKRGARDKGNGDERLLQLSETGQGKAPTQLELFYE